MENDLQRRFPLPARLLTGFGWLWFAFALVYLTDAACDFVTFFLLFGVGLAIGGVWLVSTLLHHTLLSRAIAPIWLTVPLAGILGIVFAGTDVGLLGRVALSDVALRNHVAKAQPDVPHCWVGLFHVEESRHYDGGVYLFTSHSWLNRHGVAHIPAGSKIAPRIRVRHLYGEWFRFEWKF